MALYIRAALAHFIYFSYPMPTISALLLLRFAAVSTLKSQPPCFLLSIYSMYVCGISFVCGPSLFFFMGVYAIALPLLPRYSCASHTPSHYWPLARALLPIHILLVCSPPLSDSSLAYSNNGEMMALFSTMILLSCMACIQTSDTLSVKYLSNKCSFSTETFPFSASSLVRTSHEQSLENTTRRGSVPWVKVLAIYFPRELKRLYLPLSIVAKHYNIITHFFL